MVERMMINDYVKVKKGVLEDCLTCPLCFNLLREATTICICLHTFCKECIHQKFQDDEANRCPMCNVYLGYYPEEKLRPDNNLQEIRMKVFSLKKSKERESKRTLRTLTKKKERSLSSIAISAKPTVMKPSKRREKAVPRNSGTQDVMEENYHLGQSSSLDRSNKIPLVSKKQWISGDEEPSQIVRPPTHRETSLYEKDKGSDWESLTVLAETANRTNNLSVTVCLPAYKSENNDSLKTENIKRLKGRAREPISDQRNNNANIENSFVPGERPKLNSDGAVEVIDLTEPCVSASTSNGVPYKDIKRLYPVWFTLLACNEDKKGDPYPQISKCYIRIKDGNVPVSCINRYVAHRLNLRHESEVEVLCCGQTLCPKATLNSLVDIWIQFAVPILENNSNRNDSVMVLTYRRK